MLTGIPSGGVIVAGGAVRTLASLTNLGVFYAVPNRLAVTNPGAAANTLQIDTGASMCGGFYHYNDAAVTLTVPNNLASEIIVVRQNFGVGTYTPVGSIDVDEQVPPSTARITRVPSLTQDVNLATYWDIPLMTFSTGAAGAVTLESDDREWVDAEEKTFAVHFLGGSGAAPTFDLLGVTLADAATTSAYSGFRVPGNFISDLKAYPVILPLSDAGTGVPGFAVRVRFHARAGACSEAYDNHPYDSGNTTINWTVAGAGEYECLTTMEQSLTAAALGDLLEFEFQRVGGDAADTYDQSIGAFCVILNYLGWGRK